MPARHATGLHADAATADLPAALQQRLTEADALCRQRGTQLTTLRREVLELLLRRKGSAKAYDLQDDMRQRHGRVAPTTVYRALDFLMDQGLVHRVDAVNSFVVCNSDHAEHAPGHPPCHHTLMAVCTRCGAVAELHDHAALDTIARHLRRSVPGFVETGVEVKGVCGPCLVAGAAAAADQGPGHQDADPDAPRGGPCRDHYGDRPTGRPQGHR